MTENKQVNEVTAREDARPTVNPALVAAEAERVQRAGKALINATADLVQSALFVEPEFEEALLLEPAEIEKRYTAENGKQILWRQKTAAYMLQIGCPKEHIAHLLHMNTRVVDALTMKWGRAVAAFSDEFANEVLRMAGEAFAVMRQKLPEANALQAATAGGILTDKAIAIKTLGLGAGEVTAVEAEEVNPRRMAFVERLKELTAKNAENTEKNGKAVEG